MATNTNTDKKDSGLALNPVLTTLTAFRRGDFSVRNNAPGGAEV